MKRQDKLQTYYNLMSCATEVSKGDHIAFAHDLRKAAWALYRIYQFTPEELATGKVVELPQQHDT